MSKKSTGRKYKAINPDIGLSAEQQQALVQWQRDYQKAYPVIQEIKSVAQRLWQELVDEPTWRIAETDTPEHMREQVAHAQQVEAAPMVGHAKVNYVDHIPLKGEPS